VLEATVIPLLLFYLALTLAGDGAALATAVAWSAVAILRRAVRRVPVPGVLLVGAVTLSVRTLIALASGSMFIYFLQPILGTVAVGCTFVVSIPTGCFLIRRLAEDFCPLPAAVLDRPGLRALFRSLSILWACAHFAIAGATLWLLANQSLAAFVVAKTLASLAINGTAVTLTIRMSRAAARREGIVERPAVVPEHADLALAA
jgi:hypothetical protein